MLRSTIFVRWALAEFWQSSLVAYNFLDFRLKEFLSNKIWTKYFRFDFSFEEKGWGEVF